GNLFVRAPRTLSGSLSRPFTSAAHAGRHGNGDERTDDRAARAPLLCPPSAPASRSFGARTDETEIERTTPSPTHPPRIPPA
ncbi:MAG: hypothetical protein BJ554DRAFT_11, partial [Olpidium bornovanus]